jgi:circadian clock protein KaiB
LSHSEKENQIHTPTPQTSADEPMTDGHILRLFVTGSTPRSLRAITNLRAICEEHLAGRYSLEVVDLYQHPEMAKQNNLVAAPTLIKSLPDPIRRVIGDMSDEGQVLFGLDIVPE